MKTLSILSKELAKGSTFVSIYGSSSTYKILGYSTDRKRYSTELIASPSSNHIGLIQEFTGDDITTLSGIKLTKVAI